MRPTTVLIVLLLCVPVLSQTPAVKQRRKVPAKNPAANDKRPAYQNTAAPQPIVVQLENPKDPIKEAQEKQYREDQQAYNRRVADATIALAICGILQIGVLVLQLCIMQAQRKAMTRQTGAMKAQLRTMREQLEQMKASGKQTDDMLTHASNQVVALMSSATAAGMQAKATEGLARDTTISAKAAKASSDAFMGSERAWVIVKPELPGGLVVPPQHSGTRFNWKISNVGRTPARIVSTDAATVRLSNLRSLPETPQYPGDRPWQANQHLLIPGDSYTIHWLLEAANLGIQGDLTDQEIDEIRKIKRWFVAYGFVTYIDVFDVRHTFRFCTRYNDSIQQFEPQFSVPTAYTECD